MLRSRGSCEQALGRLQVTPWEAVQVHLSGQLPTPERVVDTRMPPFGLRPCCLVGSLTPYDLLHLEGVGVQPWDPGLQKTRS